MCGIFGWSVQPEIVGSIDHIILAVTLAVLNDKRGGHSWGYAPDGKDTVVGLGDLAEHVTPRELAQYPVLMGHTRFATRGEVILKNCHPFTVGGIRGAHNGAVYNHLELDVRYNREFPVDSMHIFAHLDEHRPLDELEGYGAISWYDARTPGRLYLAKFSGELAAAAIKDIGTVWSSSETHLDLSLANAGWAQHSEQYEVKDRLVYYVEHGRLFYTETKFDVKGHRRFTYTQTTWDEDDVYGTGWAGYLNAHYSPRPTPPRREQRNGYTYIDKSRRSVMWSPGAAPSLQGIDTTPTDEEVLTQFTAADPFAADPNLGEALTVTEFEEIRTRVDDEALAEGFALLNPEE